MKIILGAIKEFNDDALILARQLGSEGFHFNTPPIATNDENYWTITALKWLREYTEKFELKLEMIENVPIRFFDKILLGLPGRDAQIANYIQTIRNMGQVGIPILGHHFCPTWAWRTTIREPYRLGSFVSAYNHAIHDELPNAYTQSKDHMVRQNPDLPPPTRESLWNNYKYFIQAVLPEAEKAGVKLIVHPSDPPMEILAGVARIFISPDDYRKADKMTSSDAWGINFCMGSFSQLGGEPCVMEMIREFVPRNKIHMVHFRDVQGTSENFKECFIGEGRYDPARVMKALLDCGYNGLVLDDHVPYLTSDTRWGHTARAYTFGYLKGLAKALDI